jgi:hypothetical protein
MLEIFIPLALHAQPLKTAFCMSNILKDTYILAEDYHLQDFFNLLFVPLAHSINNEFGEAICAWFSSNPFYIVYRIQNRYSKYTIFNVRYKTFTT